MEAPAKAVSCDNWRMWWINTCKAFDQFRKWSAVKALLELAGVWKWVVLGASVVGGFLLPLFSKLDPALRVLVLLFAATLALASTLFLVALRRVTKSQSPVNAGNDPAILLDRPKKRYIALTVVLLLLAVAGAIWGPRRKPMPAPPPPVAKSATGESTDTGGQTTTNVDASVGTPATHAMPAPGPLPTVPNPPPSSPEIPKHRSRVSPSSNPITSTAKVKKPTAPVDLPVRKDSAGPPAIAKDQPTPSPQTKIDAPGGIVINGNKGVVDHPTVNNNIYVPPSRALSEDKLATLTKTLGDVLGDRKTNIQVVDAGYQADVGT